MQIFDIPTTDPILTRTNQLLTEGKDGVGFKFRFPTKSLSLCRKSFLDLRRLFFLINPTFF
jgi:hypothetical protein